MLAIKYLFHQLVDEQKFPLPVYFLKGPLICVKALMVCESSFLLLRRGFGFLFFGRRLFLMVLLWASAYSMFLFALILVECRLYVVCLRFHFR